MSDQVLICPNCRARVFGDWAACKFCGTALRVDKIAGTVHPDELVAPDGSGAADTPAGPRSPWGHAQGGAGGGDSTDPHPGERSGSGGSVAPGASDWSSWAGSGFDADVSDDDGSGHVPAFSGNAPHGAASPPTATSFPLGNAPTGARGESNEPPSEALVPIEGGATTWVAGPAPALDDPPSANALTPPEIDAHTSSAVPDYATGASSSSTAAFDPFDQGPSGLEPVSWYTEPTSTPSGESAPEPELTHAADSAPLVEPVASTRETTSGLDPVSWYTEPDTATAPTTSGGVENPPTQDPAPSPTSAPDSDDHERFDHDALFRDPEPEPAVQSAQWDTSQAVETVAPEINWKASANAWDTPVEPKGKPTRQSTLSRESRLLIMGILVLLLVIVAGREVLKKRNNYPSNWSTNVQEVANWVASTRNEPFVHAVAVDTLPQNAYDAAVSAAGNNKDTSEGLSTQVALWRALGAVSGNPANTLGIAAIQHPEDGAFFDLKDKKLLLRAGTNPQQQAVGVAGALSIALDDQHNDLSSLRKPSLNENPLLAVVAGNAEVVRNQYVAEREPSLAGAFNARAATNLRNSANVLTALAVAQRRLGGPFIQSVTDIQGAQTVGLLTKAPPNSSQQVMNPTVFIAGVGGLTIDTPLVPNGAKVIDKGTIGALSWYFILAGRTDTASALDFASRWAGDQFVAYRKGNQVCVADQFRGTDDSNATALLTHLQNWAGQVPNGRIQVKSGAADEFTVIGCDPGASADQALAHTSVASLQFIVARSDLFAGYYRKGTKVPNGPNGAIFTPAMAWCLADTVAHAASPNELSGVATQSGAQYKNFTLAAGPSCGATLVDELFTSGSN